MSITAKELAKMLNISEAAVSMALNGKPGVSTKTRSLVLETANNHGYDFTKIKYQNKNAGTINYIIYRKDGAILKIQNTPFFNIILLIFRRRISPPPFYFISLKYLQ